MAYSGIMPAPPAAGTPASDPAWANWWAFQNTLLAHRQEDQLLARWAVVDTHHRELISTIVASQGAMAQALVASMDKPVPTRGWTEEDLARMFSSALAESGLTGLDTIKAGRNMAIALQLHYPPGSV